jgi:transposase
MIKGTNSEKVKEILYKMPESKRHKVKEVTLDMAANMEVMQSTLFLKQLLLLTDFMFRS